MIGRTCSFRSDLSIIGEIPIFPESMIREEPPLRGCSIPWARKHGGPIMQAFIDALPEEWLADERTMARAMPAWLRKGWAAGHVLWHLDGVKNRADKQEDWVSGRLSGFQRIGCNMGGNAATRVLVGDLTLPAYPLGQPLTGLWMEHLEAARIAGTVRELSINEGELFMLDSSTFHSVSVAAYDGWRMFFDVNRPHPGDVEILPIMEDLYREIDTDFQPTNSREMSLMAPYHPVDGR